MRNNSETFDLENQSPQRALRLVVEIGYDLPLYITSHRDIPGLPANAILGALKKCSATSQRLLPEQGRAEIGTIQFEVVDIAGQLSYVLRDELEQGNGIKGRTVRLYQGFAGLDWSDFRLEQTQIAEESIAYSEGVYRVRCRDIQREMRRELFVPNSTRLAADFSKTQTTLQVFDTSHFEPNPHTAAYGDAPSQSVYYLKIQYQDGFEIVRASGKTANRFTGCARGLFGTYARDHVIPTDNDDERGIAVEEFIYLEGPGPQLAYALLTGLVLGTNHTLPDNWHLGIDPALVVRDEFEHIGADWYQPGNHSKGKILRFDGLKKSDGKKFIETEINLLLGAFMPVNAAGQLGLRRMAGVLANAATVAALATDDVTRAGELKYNLAGVRNLFAIQWSWFEQPGFDGKFLRANELLDADSIATHGKAKPHTLKFRGLHNTRHTYTTIKNTFDALRDRFAGPPLTLRLGLLPSNNDLEVGDIVRVTLPQLRDHSQEVADGILDRAMEIQRISVDQVSGAVSVDLFGSYQPAGRIDDQPDSTGAELPDSWYSAEGTAMTAAGLNIDSSGFLTADGSLAGNPNSRAVFYYPGDLTIPAGRTLSVSGNSELRVRGVLQIDGTLRGVPSNSGRGFLGSCRGGSGRVVGKRVPGHIFEESRGVVITGRNAVMPPLNITNEGGDLQGIPHDLRGTGGARGGNSFRYLRGDLSYEPAGFGGIGGSGGAGLAVIARGIALGVSGKIDSSGGDGGPGRGVEPRPIPGGSGGGGAPGGVVLLVDGTQNPMPVLSNNKLIACYGHSPDAPGSAGLGDHCLGTSAVRLLFVPKSRTPYDDYEDPALDPSVQQAMDAAAEAQADANIALADLDTIAADGILHQSEKLQIIREYAQLLAQQAGLENQADGAGLTTEKADYTGNLAALTSYLGGLTPAWNNTSADTPISRTLWNINWQAAYHARNTLLNAIAQQAREAGMLGAALQFKWDRRPLGLSWPVSTNYAGGTKYTFNASAGRGYLHVLANDAEGGARVGLNGREVGVMRGDDGVTLWYSFPITLVAGANELSVWASSSDGGTYGGLVVTLGGSGDPQALLDASVADARAAAAEAAAADAQADATEALADLNTIAADGKLHPGEKPQVIREYHQLLAEQAGIETQANRYGITSEKTAYSGAITALSDYLSGTGWDNTATVTTINRSTWNSKWQAVYTQRQALLNKINQIAGSQADWDKIYGDNKPEDNATVGATLEERAQFRTRSHTFMEDFSSAEYREYWVKLNSTGGAMSYYSGGSSQVGGGAARLNDYVAM
ncbi:hypothetical protein ACL7TT_16175, partial [Microbulbifer sp. 2304DJ12-6]|uniref:hypothetical protein n=1 Tax=Microbulbifer sp. 2304DJ12-6 TaxID=3233340 RepID=UPI0039B0FDD2